METRYASFPIAGCIKHGAMVDNKPKELGYFIAKVQEAAMSHLLTKFEKQYDKQQEVVIYIFSEDAYSIKRVKRNQSGTVCYCLKDSEKAKEKINKNWVEKNCLESCESRQPKNNQKPMCQQEITLKFLIPGISKDRVWIFQSRSFNSQKNITSYINLQKQLGNSIKGYYKLFLHKKEDEKDGKTFKNYVVDIIKLDESDIKAITEKKTIKQEELKDANIVTATICKETSMQEDIKNKVDSEPKPSNKVNQKKSPSKKGKKEGIKQEATPEQTTNESNLDIPASKENLDKYYILLNTSEIEFIKDGKKTTYIQGKFINKDDKECEIILNPNFASEITCCDLGSQFLLDIQEIKGRLFATNYTTILKQIKEAV